MSNIVIRQNDLFLGEDWEVIYDAFQNVSFKEYSFDSIKVSLVNYIRQNYPEDFNDWTDNSEFMILIDLLAYLGEQVSYRVDLNARDNFIDTTERREQILRLARMLSYQPNRNIAASGKVKIRSVITSQFVVDSQGRNLQNVPILWNDPQNPDWFEQFILVLNKSFNINTPFGKPAKQTVSNGTTLQLYEMNNTSRSAVTKQFQAVAGGEAMNFEIYNPDFDILGSISEISPNPDSSQNIVYMNDGSGNGSPNTGFFLFFKQGTMKFYNYNFVQPIENRSIELPLENVNEFDVWVSEINSDGSVIQQWEKVDGVDQIVYNNVGKDVRKIFNVKTLINDKVEIQFQDGRFGQVPKGLFRIWARESNGLEYTINPQDIKAKAVQFDYNSNTSNDRDGKYELTIAFDLFDTVQNQAETESNEQIKERAPRTYYTQNRMTNGEDYNSFPLSFGQNVLKLKASNRIYSGQSPYFDNNDPTKKYSSTVEFGDDGIVYKQEFNGQRQESFPTSKTPSEITTTNITPLLNSINSELFFIEYTGSFTIPTVAKWKFKQGQKNIQTGYLEDSSQDNIEISDTSPIPFNYIKVGSYVLFESGTNKIWTKIVELNDLGIDSGDLIGPIVLDEYVPDGYTLTKVLPQFRQTLTQDELDDIVFNIESRNTFGVSYDFKLDRWIVIDELNVSPEESDYSLTNFGSTTNTNQDQSWLVRVQYSSLGYKFVQRYMRYVFESENISRFFFLPDSSGTNFSTGESNISTIEILKYNFDFNTNTMLQSPLTFKFNDNIRYSDGYIDPRRVEVVPFDSDKDNAFDNPDIFEYLTYNPTTTETFVFYVRQFDTSGFAQNVPTDKIYVQANQTGFSNYDWDNNPDELLAAYSIDDDSFFEYNGNFVYIEGKYFAFIGRNDLTYKYEHYADQNSRIDPAITNVIDMYVLTSNYYKNVVDWKNQDRNDTFPVAELSSQIQQSFSSLNDFKMISDQMIWNSSKFTLLFGPQANQENQVIIKIVKVQSSQLTDNQIKQNVLFAIEEYFDINNWEFGETIYISELTAYIHSKLIQDLASVQIVKKESIGQTDIDIYEIRQEFNALPLNTATIDDIKIIPSAAVDNVKNRIF